MVDLGFRVAFKTISLISRLVRNPATLVAHFGQCCSKPASIGWYDEPRIVTAPRIGT